MADYILAIDQGTTSSRAFIFDTQMNIVGRGQQEFAQIFPKSGWVEHDAADIWASVCISINQAYMQANLTPTDIAAIGITNQRETTLVWDKATGVPIYNAIVWQDRRTDAICKELKACGHEAEFSHKTGLVLDPYFSGTKVKWILDSVEGARPRAENGQLCFGTVDSYLIWKLSKGQAHVTDITNASRTLMYNINDFSWDTALTAHLDIPMTMLPEVRDCDAYFGTTNADIFGAEVPICGVAGDQHAALIGQACFSAGMMKATFGTGCFAVLNTGAKLVRSENRLISTIAYKIDNEVCYALEGSIFIAGAAVQWLRDGLGIIEDAQQAGVLAQEADDTQEIYLVPAFAGLGAPHWDANARGALYGLNRNTGPKEFARAALEAVCYQTYDLLDAMQEDRRHTPDDTILRVDGGMVASDYTLQFLADILNCPVDRPQILETTILGVAWLAGKNIGMYPQRDGFAQTWKREKQFTAKMDAETRETKLAGWHDAVRRTLS